jgi:endoglucanase
VAVVGVLLLAAPSIWLIQGHAAGLGGLKVVGNRITDASGIPLMLRGFNRSGTEYACIQGWGIFDGPSDAASVAAMRAWRANYVRVLLNEDCWLNINMGGSTYGGATYRNAVVNFVNLLNANSIYVELSLIWGAPGTYAATYQPGAPDEDHSPAFWTSVATTFKSNPDVFFGVWGEPTVGWTCLRDGCSNEATYGPGNAFYQTAGTQQLVDTIRATGATQPIAVPGITYANDLTQWLTYEPADSLHSLVAEAHIYGNNTCGAQGGGACLTSSIAPVAAVVPVVFGETGETYDGSECTSANMQVILPWADSHNVSYAAWTWDTWGDCLSLVSNYDGTVNTTAPGGARYAQYVHDHLLAVTGGRLPVSQGASSGGGGRAANQSGSSTPGPRIAVRAYVAAPRLRPAPSASG